MTLLKTYKCTLCLWRKQNWSWAKPYTIRANNVLEVNSGCWGNNNNSNNNIIIIVNNFQIFYGWWVVFHLFLWVFIIFWLYVIYTFFFYLRCFFWPSGVGYTATRIFDSGWMEYCGGQDIYWFLFNLGRTNQWFQYNNLKVFLDFFVMWIVILLFVLIYYLNSL